MVKVITRAGATLSTEPHRGLPAPPPPPLTPRTANRPNRGAAARSRPWTDRASCLGRERFQLTLECY